MPQPSITTHTWLSWFVLPPPQKNAHTLAQPPDRPHIKARPPALTLPLPSIAPARPLLAASPWSTVQHSSFSGRSKPCCPACASNRPPAHLAPTGMHHPCPPWPRFTPAVPIAVKTQPHMSSNLQYPPTATRNTLPDDQAVSPGRALPDPGAPPTRSGLIHAGQKPQAQSLPAHVLPPSHCPTPPQSLPPAQPHNPPTARPRRPTNLSWARRM